MLRFAKIIYFLYFIQIREYPINKSTTERRSVATKIGKNEEFTLPLSLLVTITLSTGTEMNRRVAEIERGIE